MGLSEDELPGLVSTWRNANPHITQFWWDVDEAAVRAVRGKERNTGGADSFSICFWYFVCHAPVRKETCLCKTENGCQQIWQGWTDLMKVVGENEEMGRMDYLTGPKARWRYQCKVPAEIFWQKHDALE